MGAEPLRERRMAVVYILNTTTCLGVYLYLRRAPRSIPCILPPGVTSGGTNTGRGSAPAHPVEKVLSMRVIEPDLAGSGVSYMCTWRGD